MPRRLWWRKWAISSVCRLLLSRARDLPACSHRTHRRGGEGYRWKWDTRRQPLCSAVTTVGGFGDHPLRLSGVRLPIIRTWIILAEVGTGRNGVIRGGHQASHDFSTSGGLQIARSPLATGADNARNAAAYDWSTLAHGGATGGGFLAVEGGAPIAFWLRITPCHNVFPLALQRCALCDVENANCVYGANL